MGSHEGSADVGPGADDGADAMLLSASLGAAFRRARTAAGLTLEDLARRSNLPREVIAALEVSAGDCGIDVLHAIAHVLKVPLTHLLAEAVAASK
jgi:transcriptional regulator with XRE-family HTH domain